MQAQDGQVERRRQARNTGASQLANQHIGERIRLRRTLLGLSQAELGKALGLSFQQMQKYERGASAIGAGRHCHINFIQCSILKLYYLNGHIYGTI